MEREIKRLQNTSGLIGHIVFNGDNVVEITGNNDKTGFVEFNGKSNVWIGAFTLRDSFTVVDITGLGIRKALKEIKKTFPSRCKFMKEKHLKMRMPKQ